MKTPSSVIMRAWGRILLLWICAAAVVRGEIREIDLVLPATTASIRYTDGYIRAPGSIDLRHLTFTTIAEGFDDTNDDVRRDLQGQEDGAFAVDIAIFRLDPSCAGTRSGCD